MNTMSYKGFIAVVSFSEEDSVFFGKIEGINSLVNFEGDSVSQLTEAFHSAVDDYISYCEKNNLPAHRSYNGSLNIRISPQMHERIATLSHMQGISINSFIKGALSAQISLY